MGADLDFYFILIDLGRPNLRRARLGGRSAWAAGLLFLVGSMRAPQGAAWGWIIGWVASPVGGDVPLVFVTSVFWRLRLTCVSIFRRNELS